MEAIARGLNSTPSPHTAVPLPLGFISPCCDKDLSQEDGQICDLCQVSRSRQVLMGAGSPGGCGGCWLEPQCPLGLDLGFLKNGGWCWRLQLSRWDRKSGRTCALQASEGKGLGVL